jgi:hypothetical protein
MLALTTARRRAAPGSHKPTGAASMVEVAGSCWKFMGCPWNCMVLGEERHAVRRSGWGEYAGGNGTDYRQTSPFSSD